MEKGLYQRKLRYPDDRVCVRRLDYKNLETIANLYTENQETTII